MYSVMPKILPNFLIFLIVLPFMFSCTTIRKTEASTPLTNDTSLVLADTIDNYNYHNDRVTGSFDLPSWLDFSTINPVSEEIYTIGISDPGLDPNTAYNQAVSRSKLVTSLLIASKISDCKEIYTNETGKTNQSDNAAKFTRFQVIKTKLVTDDSQFELIDSTTSRYGEKIVILKYHNSPGSPKNPEIIQSNIDVMLAEYNLRTKFQENRYFDCVHKITSQEFTEEASYRLYKVDEISDIVSTFNNQSINFKTDTYKYLLQDASQVPDYPVKTKLYYGLWKAVFESIVLQLANSNAPSKYAMQTMRDDYINENGNKSQSIDQQIHTIDFSGKITRLFISENELTLQIEKTKP
jgi:hypothetical protein